MIQDIKKNFFSFAGLAAFAGIAGAISAFVTMFVDTTNTISIRWLIATVLISLWVAAILLKIIFNLKSSSDRQGFIGEEFSKALVALEHNNGNIINAIAEVKKELDSERVAITATCIPFEYKSTETCCLYVIQNPNFDDWWLAPGGHADLREQAYPDKIATEKCLAEAGLSVDLLPGPRSSAGAYATCEVRVAPHFCYVLDLPSTSRCAKSRHHRFHYDLTYVAQVKAHLSEQHASLQSKSITLRFDMTQDEVQKAMIDAVHPKGQKLNGLTPFPPDLPARVHAALSVFQSCANPNQLPGEPQ